MIKSKFRIWAFFTLLIAIFCTGLLYLIITKIFLSSVEKPSATIYGCTFFLGFTWIVLIFGELRRRAITIIIENDMIKTRSYFGLGSTRVFSIQEFDGFITSTLPSQSGTYEYLYLIKGDKKTITISQFYHKNYSEMKNIISSKIKNIGFQRFNVLAYFKDIF